MATPYSQDLRDRVLRAYDRRIKTTEIAESLNVSRSCARPNVVHRRAQRRSSSQHTHAKRLIFIDETWAKTNMTRLCGRAPQRKSLIVATLAELMYLPPYSPDLNPIELNFSKLKHRLRTKRKRTQVALWKSMQPVLDSVTTSDASGV